jgi:hypothetical protein
VLAALGTQLDERRTALRFVARHHRSATVRSFIQFSQTTATSPQIRRSDTADQGSAERVECGISLGKCSLDWPPPTHVTAARGRAEADAHLAARHPCCGIAATS